MVRRQAQASDDERRHGLKRRLPAVWDATRRTLA
jgi:hypothetical protein